MNVSIQDTALNALFGEKTESVTGIVKGPFQKEQRKTVFAGDLNLDPIAEKKKKAQEKAMKIMQDAWAQDRAVADSIAKREENAAKMRDEIKALNDEIGELNDKETALMQEYGIDPDSQEQKDLELLKKQQDINKGLLSRNSLSEEESARLKELEQVPRTEYQERALALNDARGVRQLKKEEYEKQMKDDLANARAIRQAALENAPMQDAQKEIDEIYEQLSDEIQGMIRQDGMEHLDELQKENEEKAEKTKEKQEEKEEELAETMEKRAIEEAMMMGTEEAIEKAEAIHRRNEASTDLEIGDITEYNKITTSSGSTKESLDEIRASMNLLEADLKGIQVDKEV